ncbi:MAG: hypothetical protein ACFUZC_06405 [Chthoniobacteraceae bacterium]
MDSPRLVYFGQTPDQGTGSPVILLRHLRRLAAGGWRIELVTEDGQSDALAEKWPIHHLSLRKPWWPPFRAGNRFLRSLRMRLWAGECARFFPEAPQAIVSYLSLYSEMHSEVAAHYARRCSAPLTLIIHDYPPDFPGFDRRQTAPMLRRSEWILKQAHQLWFVSPELADQYDVPASKKHVLPPIPEGVAERARWRAENARPLIVYAGFAYPAQMPLFARLARVIAAAGGRLLILSRSTPELCALCEAEPVEHRDLFPTNREALDFITRNASAVLVSYSERVEEMPWTRTSFPSKFVEFSQTGLPALLVAPRETALGQWATRNAYPDFYAPERIENAAAFVEALKTERGWAEKSANSSHFAETEFNPDVIQSAFEAGLR